MLALRLGSYSMATTLAGTPSLSRRKSTVRYCRLWPPPRCQITISPWLLRPPERFFGSSSCFSGVCLVIWLLSTTVMKRRDAVYGLKLLSPISASIFQIFPPPWRTSQQLPGLQILRVLDHLLAFGELHVRLLPVAAIAFILAAAAHLAVKIGGAHSGHFHLEDLLHGFLDFGLRGGGGNFKYHGVLQFLHAESLFRDDGTPDNLIVRGCHGLLLPLLGGRLFCHCGFLGRGFRRCLGRRFLFGCGRGRDRFHMRRFDGLAIRVERMAQTGDGILGNQQAIVAQHIVRLQHIRRGELHTLHIAAGQFQIAVFAVDHQQSGLRGVQLVKRGAQRLGLVRFERPGIHHRQLFFRQLRGERRTQRAKHHLLRQRVFVRPRLRAVHGAAMAPQRRTDRAHAGAPRTLLPPEFAAGAADFALILGLGGAAAEPVEVPPRSFVQQVPIDLRTKDRVRQFDLADFVAFQIDYVHDWHSVFSLDPVVTAFFVPTSVVAARSCYQLSVISYQ